MSPVSKGKYVSIRLATIEDAEYILSIRNRPENSLFLNPTSSDLDLQVKWMQLEAQDLTSRYFIILNSLKAPIGTISIYNILDGHGEFGRWICSGSSLESLESAWLLHHYSFKILNLESVYSRTLAKNKKVLNFHHRFGARLNDTPYYEEEYRDDVIRGIVTKDMFRDISPRIRLILDSFS